MPEGVASVLAEEGFDLLLHETTCGMTCRSAGRLASCCLEKLRFRSVRKGVQGHAPKLGVDIECGCSLPLRRIVTDGEQERAAAAFDATTELSVRARGLLQLRKSWSGDWPVASKAASLRTGMVDLSH